MSAVAVLFVSVMASLLGWGVGEVVDGLAPWLASTISGTVAFMSGILASGRPSGVAGSGWRRLELLGALAGSVALYLVFGGDRDPLAVAAVVVIGVMSRSLAVSTLIDVDLTRRVTDDRMGAGPVRRIRTRVVAYGLVLAFLVGFAEASRVGAFDLGRGASGRALVPVILWFGVGMAGVGAVSLWAREWRWRRDGFEVGPQVVDRWIAGTVVVVLATMVVAVGLPYVSGGSSALPARGIANAGGVGQWISERLERLSDVQTDAGDAGEPGDAAGDPAADVFDLGSGDPPDWLGEAVALAILGSFFLLAVRAGRRASGAATPPTAAGGGWSALVGSIKAVAMEAWRVLGSILGFLRRLVGSRASEVAPSDAPGLRLGAGSGPGWSPGDPGRRRVGRAFARIASLVEPHPGETPVDVATELSDAPVGSARTVVDAYRFARYSEHPIPAGLVERVDDAADRVFDHRARPGDG